MTVAIAVPAPVRLTELLDQVARDCADLGRVSLGDLIIRLDDRATIVLLALFALPFITPVPTAGLSMPFGLAAAVIGVGIAMGRQPPWPQRLLRLNLPAGLVGRLISAGSRVWGLVDRLLRPRLPWVVTATPWRWLHGIVAVVSGVLLALPLPIPFTNALPAITLLALAAGLMQRDGLALLAAHVGFIVTIAFFTVLAWLGWEGVQRLVTWWS
jgi:hypothetical protein